MLLFTSALSANGENTQGPQSILVGRTFSDQLNHISSQDNGLWKTSVLYKLLAWQQEKKHRKNYKK